MEQSADNKSPLSQLTDDECQVLIGLLMVVVNADQQYTMEESRELRRVAQAIGQQRFLRLAGSMRQTVESQQHLIEAARTVEQPHVRQLIYAEVKQAAACDGVVHEEQRLLDWLASVWQLG